jgi:hypothetical protein
MILSVGTAMLTTKCIAAQFFTATCGNVHARRHHALELLL